MEKKLVACGNGMALVIDKSIRKLLGIGRNTRLRLTTDGRRLVVEPLIDTPPPPMASELDALATMRTLVDRFDMSQQQFERLHHEKMRMFAYQGWLQAGLASTGTDADRATFRRFEACLRALRGGAPWDDAITMALEVEPRCPLPEPTATGDGELVPDDESAGAAAVAGR